MNDYLCKENDDEFALIPSMKYYPWVGKNFTGGFKEKKILIIAESVYDWDEGSPTSEKMLSCPDFARKVVHEHGLYFTAPNGIRNSNTYRNFERGLYGEKDISDLQLKKLWEGVALHQYIQRPMKNIKERPNRKDYENGFQVLKKVIVTLKPDVCILMGTSWDKIRPFSNSIIEGSYEELDKINNAIPKKCSVLIENHKFKLLAIKHPGMYFSWDLWHKKVIAETVA